MIEPAVVVPNAFPVKPVLVVKIEALGNVTAPASAASKRCAPPWNTIKEATLPVVPVASEMVIGKLPERVRREAFAISRSVPAPPAIVSVFAADVVKVASVPLMTWSRAIVSVGTELMDGAGLVLPSMTSTSLTLAMNRVGFQLARLLYQSTPPILPTH